MSASASAATDRLALADWRRQVSDLYADVRRAPDPARGHALWSARRDQLIRNHPQSPLSPADRPAYRGIDVYAYDPSLRFLAEIDRAARPTMETWDLGPDGKLGLTRVAETRGLARRLGRELSLFWLEGYGGGLFLPFADATSGRETYGGGRYLLDTIKGADLGAEGDRLVLDFNFAYHPSCALSQSWTCPLAPPDNVVAVPVRAGERRILWRDGRSADASGAWQVEEIVAL